VDIFLAVTRLIVLGIWEDGQRTGQFRSNRREIPSRIISWTHCRQITLQFLMFPPPFPANP
jgi:hypothetical protein